MPLGLSLGYAGILLAASAIRAHFGGCGTLESEVQIVSMAGRFLPGGSFIYLLLAASAVALYALSVIHAHRFPARLAAFAFAVFCVLLLVVPPLMSLDVYSYAVRGRVLSVHHANPYVHPAAQFAGDPFLAYAAPLWNSVPQNYGPLESCLEALLSAAGGSRPGLVFLLFRVWSFLGLAVAAWLVAGIARPLAEPERRRCFLLFAWNPLLLLEFANQAHNDIWMLALGLAAFRLHREDKPVFAAACLTLAGLIKYIYWLLLPLFFFELVREKRISLRRAAAMILVSAAVAAAFYTPFWSGLATFSGILAQSPLRRPFYQYSPPLVIGALILGPARVVPEPAGSARTILSGILLASQLAFAVIYVWQALSRGTLARRCSSVLTAFALLGSGTLLPWYTAWWIPFLVVEGRRFAVIAWTCISLGAYLLFYSTSFSLAVLGIPLALVLRNMARNREEAATAAAQR